MNKNKSILGTGTILACFCQTKLDRTEYERRGHLLMAYLLYNGNQSIVCTRNRSILGQKKFKTS